MLVSSFDPQSSVELSTPYVHCRVILASHTPFWASEFADGPHRHSRWLLASDDYKPPVSIKRSDVVGMAPLTCPSEFDMLFMCGAVFSGDVWTVR